MNKNKRPIIVLSIAVGLLLVALIAVSYAMFSASFTGTKENKLKVGTILMNCNETNFTLSNTRALTDEQGIALTNNEATCTLTATINGTMNIGYDVALSDVTPSAGITTSDVKIQASKTENSNTAFLAGTSATTGVLISSLSSSAGQYDNTITNYKIDSAVLNSTSTILYKIKAWVASESGSSTTTNENGVCSDETYTTQEACETAGEIWGYNQKIGKAGGTFSFKLKVGASQVLN